MEISIIFVLISIIISLVISTIKALHILRFWHKLRSDPVLYYILNLFVCIAVYSVSELLNIAFCWQSEDIQLVCSITWELYSIGQQAALSWMTVLMFTLFYVLTTQNAEFIMQLRKANVEFTLCCFGLPIAVNLGAMFDYMGDKDRTIEMRDKNLDLFQASLTPDQLYAMTIPIGVLLAITIMFVGLNFRVLAKNNAMATSFKERINQESIVLGATIVGIYVPLIVVSILGGYDNQNPSLNLVQQIVMISINTILTLVYFYNWGLNCSIQQVIMLKLSLFKSLHFSNLEVSQTQTYNGSSMRTQDHNGQSSLKIKSKLVSQDSNRIKKVNSTSSHYELSPSARSQKDLPDGQEGI